MPWLSLFDGRLSQDESALQPAPPGAFSCLLPSDCRSIRAWVVSHSWAGNLRNLGQTRARAASRRKLMKPGFSPRRHTWLILSGLAALILAIAAWALWNVQVKPENPDEIWQRAQGRFRARRYDEVAADLERLSQLRPPTPSDWFLRAELAAIKEHLVEAIADLENVPDEHPIAAEANLIAGQIERRRNRVRYAERALLAAVRLDPSLALAHRELIRIYGVQVRRAEFNREFEVLAAIDDPFVRRCLPLDIGTKQSLGTRRCRGGAVPICRRGQGRPLVKAGAGGCFPANGAK